MRQEGLSEIVDSLQSQYIEASGCFYGTASPSQSLSDSSPPLAAGSRKARSQADDTCFEYIPESSTPPEYLQPGEWNDISTQQPSLTCVSTDDSVDSCSSHRQYSAEISNVLAFSHLNTPGLGLSSKVSEIAETPAHPPGSGADISCLGSFPLDNTPSHNHFTSETLGPSGHTVRGSVTCASSLTFCSHFHRLRVCPVNLSKLNSRDSFSTLVTTSRTSQR